jgi:hypothetical protein
MKAFIYRIGITLRPQLCSLRLKQSLLLATALAGSLLGFATLIPNAALAADHNECGAIPGSSPFTVNCNGTFAPGTPSGNVNGGIEYNPTSSQNPFN